MRKSMLVMFLMFVIGMTAQAQNFALIDMEYILKNIPAYENANKQLSQMSQQCQKEVEKLSQEAKTLYQNYQNAKNLTSAQKAQKEDEIVAKEKSAAELRRKYFGPEGDLAKKREALINPIENQIYEVVKAIATQQGYDAVIDRASATSLIFASPNIDISNEVLANLGYSN